MKKRKHCKTNIIYQSTSHNEACVGCISPRCSIFVCMLSVLGVWVFVLVVTKMCAFLLRDY